MIKKVPVEQESSLSMGGTIMTSQRKLDTVGIWSTKRKRAKRMPDIIVETTPTPFANPRL